MSLERDATEEHCWLTELHSDFTRLREEIRCAFARLRHTLNSREICLLDQVDSIKEASTSMLITQQMTMTRVNAKLEECAQYLRLSEEQGNETGIQCVANMMEDLRIQANVCQSQQEVPFPQVKFAHNSNQMRNTILSYGKLETDSEDVNSERSWDLVQEKDVSESVVSYEHKGCQSTPCCKEAKDIEDMEFACVESDDDFDFENIDLSQVCKANEICTTTSECVCDSPCFGELVKKDRAGKTNNLGMSLSQVVDGNSSDKSSEMSNLDYTSQGGQEDVLRQITNSVERLLSPHTNISAPKEKATSGCDYMDHLQLKLQGILDGTETNASESNAVESKKLAEAMDYSEARQNECFRACEFTSIDSLHNKLQSIFNQTDDSVASFTIENPLDKDCTSLVKSDALRTPSLICNLNARLQAILDGSNDPDVEFTESKEPTMIGEEVRLDEMPSSSLTKDNALNILHGKLHGILENDVAASEKVDDMSEIPELVKQDPVVDLHMRIVNILENTNSLSSEDDNVSARKRNECLDPVSMLSNRMQSLISG